MPRIENGHVVITNDEGEDIELPTQWAICSECNGDGKHSQRLGAITQSERERDWDEESWETYLRGGYDRTCDSCSGSGKVLEVDVDKLTPEQGRLWVAWVEDEAEYRQMRRMERDMGA